MTLQQEFERDHPGHKAIWAERYYSDEYVHWLEARDKRIKDAPRCYTPLEYTGTNLIPDFTDIRSGVPTDQDEQYDIFAMVKIDAEEAEEESTQAPELQV